MKTKTLLVLFLALALVAGCAPKQPEKLSFSIATGGTGGVWYPLGGAIGAQVTQNVPNTEATAESTTAAIDNLKLLVAGKVGMAFCYDYHVIWANEGKLTAVSDKKEPIRIVVAFYEQPFHVVTREDTGIRSLSDLKGRRVSTGAPNSGTEEQAGYVLKALGIDWDKDLTREKLGATESVAALKDGKIDAFFWSGAVPTSSIIDLASTPGLKMVLLPISGEVADSIMKANPGVFHKSKFAKGAYPGLEADVETLAITAVLAAMESFPADRLYQIVSTIFDKRDALAAVWKGASRLTPESSMAQLGPEAKAYLHSGAAKYFKEKGALK
ncbi:MAG: TAXI family TRAP transporter solute-binding subunit [Anaerolineae bacterium]